MIFDLTLKENKEKFFNNEDAWLQLLLSNLNDITTWFIPSKIDEWVCCVMTIVGVKFNKFTPLVFVCEQKCDMVSLFLYLNFDLAFLFVDKVINFTCFFLQKTIFKESILFKRFEFRKNRRKTVFKIKF